MKRLGLIALLLAHGSAYAVNPVQGWYGGILLGVNYTPSASNFVFPSNRPIPAEVLAHIDTSITPGVPFTLSYQTMGQLAGQVGYRYDHYRIEGQLDYNNSPYSSIKVGNNFVLVTNSSTTTDPYYTFKGKTDIIAGMVNGYYDFLPTDPSSSFVPYLGVGIGYAYVANSFKVQLVSAETGVVASVSPSAHSTSAAGQAIIGGSYFLDDFAYFGLDFRYLTTATISPTLGVRPQVYTVNLSFNGAFNAG